MARDRRSTGHSLPGKLAWSPMSDPPKGRPYVLLNMSMSADGKIASPERRINHFSSPRDHERLYQLRATADAIMNGARTVDTEPVRMDTGPERFRRLRLRSGLREHALRVIVSGSGSVNPRAEVFRHRFSPIVILTTERCPQPARQRLESVADQLIAAGESCIDFAAALRELRRQWRVQRLLCEGGGALNDALFRADLIDEINLTICPLIIGGVAAPTISDGEGIARLADARRFTLARRKRIGDELFLTYHRRR